MEYGWSGMKKALFYIAPLILPFLVMIIINENYSPTVANTTHKYIGVKTQNSNILDRKLCSWACHNTMICQVQHTSKWPDFIEKPMGAIYVGIIRSLRSTGDYSGANVLFLVILWPLIMYVMLIWIMRNSLRIRTLKANKST